jgi:hypothetical protein
LQWGNGNSDGDSGDRCSCNGTGATGAGETVTVIAMATVIDQCNVYVLFRGSVSCIVVVENVQNS